MRALVIYESMFGNTQIVAEAIATGLSDSVDVETTDVGSAPPVVGDRFDLLVVGGPTHAFGLSREGTRTSAVGRGAPAGKAGVGLRDWLRTVEIPDLAHGAAFATRLETRWVPGSAARSAARLLERRGVQMVLPAADFFVGDVAGPLISGEEARAAKWGRALGTALMAAPPRGPRTEPGRRPST